jgi:hypothetical protein
MLLPDPLDPWVHIKIGGKPKQCCRTVLGLMTLFQITAIGKILIVP